MIYAFRLPTINPHMTGARIECLFAKPGDPLKVGAKLLDLGIDLSSAFSQDCPPISFFRIVMREPVYLRALAFERGQQAELDDLIALFSVGPDDDLTEAPARQVRVTTAGIIHHDGLWTGSKT